MSGGRGAALPREGLPGWPQRHGRRTSSQRAATLAALAAVIASAGLLQAACALTGQTRAFVGATRGCVAGRATPCALRPAAARSPSVGVAAKHPKHEVLMGFKLPGSDEVREVTVTMRPLGLNFEPGVAPITVTDVEENSHGAELGVKKGWVIASIRGQDALDLSFEQTQTLLRDCMEHVPDRAFLVRRALDKGDFQEAFRLFGVPLWVLPAVELFILVAEIAIVVLLVRLLPAEWLTFLPDEVQSLLHPA